MEDKNYGELLKKLRAKCNLTQDNVARMLGVSFITISRWELGTQKPRRRMREDILKLVKRVLVKDNWNNHETDIEQKDNTTLSGGD